MCVIFVEYKKYTLSFYGVWCLFDIVLLSDRRDHGQLAARSALPSQVHLQVQPGGQRRTQLRRRRDHSSHRVRGSWGTGTPGTYTLSETHFLKIVTSVDMWVSQIVLHHHINCKLRVNKTQWIWKFVIKIKIPKA